MTIETLCRAKYLPHLRVLYGTRSSVTETDATFPDLTHRELVDSDR